MNSLRARIALWYAALIVIVIALGAVAIDFAFRSLLIDQTRLTLVQTADEIERTAASAGSYGFNDEIPLVLTLADRATLDHWASASEYVQIDNLAGQAIGKSSNLGDYTFPPYSGNPAHAVTRYADAGQPRGTMLILSRVLTAADGRPLAVAHLGQRLDIVDALTEKARTILLAVTLGALAVILAASYFIAGTAIDPILRLTSAIAGIGSDRLDLRLRWRRGDEVGRLASAFDAMLDRLQSAFARERQFISDASHELRTPLTVINANAQLLRRWGDRDEAVRADSVAAIAEESERLAAMVSGMLMLAKAESGDAIVKEPLVLERLVDDVVAHATDRATARGLRLAAHHPAAASTVVMGAEGLLRQLVANLIDNALKFTESGSIDVAVERAGDDALVTVADTGPGIAASTADRLFDRFFRGDPAHARTVDGTGLGLAIVRSIVRVHGGTVSAEPRPEGGSLFTVRLRAEPESLTPVS